MSSFLLRILAVATLIAFRPVQAQFVAFNDHAPGTGTSPNATTWHATGSDPGVGGFLKDIATGAQLPVRLTITRSGEVVADVTQSQPAPGSPAYSLFNGFVDFQGSPNPSIEIAGVATVTYTITGLNPNRRYSFMGTAIRGNAGFTDRWTLFELIGAVTSTPAHTQGALTSAQVPAIPQGAAAINVGYNSSPETGDVAIWLEIDPGLDGSIAIRCQQYTGAVPGGTALSTKSYAMTGMRLEEVALVPANISSHPQSQTVDELQPVTFDVLATGTSLNFQWRRNGEVIPGATGSSYVLPGAALSDNGAVFTVVVSNQINGQSFTATSEPATLTVRPDTTAPSLISVKPLGLDQLELTFSEAVSGATATNVSQYAITGPAGAVAISNARFGASPSKIILNVEALTEHLNYSITLGGIADLSSSANTIPANTVRDFVPLTFAPQDIGSPLLSGSIKVAPGGYDLSGSGSGLNSTRDQFQFAHQIQIGDFDIKARVADLGITDAYVKAGLMARATLADNAPFAATFASSAQLGSYFASRTSIGGAVALDAPVGKFPANYPWAWLRLRRVGNTFTGFGSFDGTAWQQLSANTVTMPAQCYFGLAVSSETTNAVTTASFRDIGPVENPTTFAYVPNREPIGPSNRRTGLTFSEIMYAPKARPDGKDLEFIEIYNGETILADLTGWTISDGIEYKFPDGFILQAGEFVVIAADPEAVKTAYGLPRVLGPYQGRLNNGGETVLLNNKSGARRVEVTYSPEDPWPAATDEAGHSLVLLKPSYGEDDPRAWAASALVNGSPGYNDPIVAHPLDGLMINEFLAAPNANQFEFVELYNASNGTVDLSGAFLTDSTTTNKFRIPDGTTLPARGWITFTAGTLGFGLSTAGESIYLITPGGERVLDAVAFGPQEVGVSSGRSPDGSPVVRRLASVTPATSNSSARIESIVINEIMYEPISQEQDDQYVELFNRSTDTVDLSNWRFSDGITYTFPAGASIGAGSYIVVARNIERMRTNYTHLKTEQLFGPFSGNLSGSGERVALAKPVLNDEGGTIFVTTHEVTYMSGGRWGGLANGGGSSLELIDARSDARQASNWAASDETQKDSWTTYEVTSTMSFPNQSFAASKAYIVSMGGGEYLVDNLEVIRVSDGVNLLSNPGFESGQTGWIFYGNHIRSSIVSTGADTGNNALHLRGDDVGDTAPNSVRGNLTTAVPANSSVTLRARVRWLSGWPELLFRVRGNGVELPIVINPPKNLGSPGQPNSRRRPNAGPSISEVTHSPSVPQAGQTVRVTARIGDPDGVAQPRLIYRVDPSTTTSTLVMRDDGASGDALGGDGIYTATLPARQSGLVAFRIDVQDTASTPASSLFPPDAPALEALVRWNDPSPFGSVANYHVWMTSSSSSDLTGGPGLDRKYRDCTTVYHTRVIYNTGIRNKGSPYHSGRGSFSVSMPNDELLLDDDKNVFSSTGNGTPEGTQMANDVSYWIAGQMDLPYNHSHYVRMYRNGSLQYAVSYNRETPSRGSAEDWFGGGGLDDTLYKIALWFEFDDSNGNGTGSRVDATLTRKPIQGPPYKTGAYRWNWQSHPGGKTVNDYTLLFNLIAAANAQDKVTQLSALADMEQWMRVFAFNRVIGNWDHWSFDTGQNMYLYAPLGEKAQLIPWDIDFSLGLGRAASENNIFSATQDGVIRTLFNVPTYRRMMWRAYLDAANGPLERSASDIQFDARRSMLLKNGISTSSNLALKNYVAGRRSFLLAQARLVDAAAFTVANQDFSTNASTAILTGVAPFGVATIEINGVPHPVNWTANTAWNIQAPLASGVNVLRIVGKDLRGNIYPGADKTVTVTYNGEAPRVQDWVVINEIMFHPLQRDAEFVEIFNRHPSRAFDLSGVMLRPLGFTFPAGTFIAPNSFLVVAEDSASFAAAYGPTLPLAGEFQDAPRAVGETLQLVKPGATPAEDLVISEVRYENEAPWPIIPTRSNVSLQLIDASQDTRRLNNWAVSASAPFATPTAPNSVVGTLPGSAIWINEVLAVNTAGLRDSTGQPKPWIELHNPNPHAVSLDGLHLANNYTNLAQWAFPPDSEIGPGEFKVVFIDNAPELTTPTEWHAGFTLAATNGSVVLSRLEGDMARPLDYVNYATSLSDKSWGSHPDGQPIVRLAFDVPTPGASNRATIVPTAPVITAFRLDGAGLRLDWTAIAGANYRIEVTENLSSGPWTPVQNGIRADGASMTARIQLDAAPQRFLRVVQVP